MSETTETALAPGRFRAVRHLMRPHHMRDSMALVRQPSLRNSALAGFQAALTLAIALPIMQLSPYSDLAGFAALGALVALFGRFAPEGRRARIVLLCGLVQVSAVLTMSLAVWAGASAVVQLLLLAVLSGVFFFVSVTGQFGPPGVLIFVFAAGASMGHGGDLQDIAARVLATGLVAVLGLVVCIATEGIRHAAGPDRPLPSEPERPLGHRLLASARIALGTAIAGLVGHALGAPHPAWAAMGTIAVIQGQHLHLSLNRALQRMVGTTAGALVVWLILTHDPSAWSLIGILILLQFATEVIIGSNYGLGQILITPMALLMSHLAAPHVSGPAMAPERVWDTLLGVTLGMVIAVLFSSVDDRVHLARHHGAPKG